MIIVHENTQERLDDYLEHRLHNYEIITPPIPKKPEIVTQDDHKQKNRKTKKGPLGPFNFGLNKWIIKSTMIKLPETNHN